MADYLYLNNNPRGTTCPECRRHIGKVFSYRDRPVLPRHEHCYCYYLELVGPPPPAPPPPAIPVPAPVPAEIPEPPSTWPDPIAGVAEVPLQIVAPLPDPRPAALPDPRPAALPDPRPTEPEPAPSYSEPAPAPAPAPRPAPEPQPPASNPEPVPAGDPIAGVAEVPLEITDPLPYAPATTAPSTSQAILFGPSPLEPGVAIAPETGGFTF